MTTDHCHVASAPELQLYRHGTVTSRPILTTDFPTTSYVFVDCCTQHPTNINRKVSEQVRRKKDNNVRNMTSKLIFTLILRFHCTARSSIRRSGLSSSWMNAQIVMCTYCTYLVLPVSSQPCCHTRLQSPCSSTNVHVYDYDYDSHDKVLSRGDSTEYEASAYTMLKNRTS